MASELALPDMLLELRMIFSCYVLLPTPSLRTVLHPMPVPASPHG